jgi:hypothetical protein
MYMDGKSFTVTVDDPTVASVQMVGDKMLVLGIKEGQTKASVTGSRTDEFVITVRKAANGNGWL